MALFDKQRADLAGRRAYAAHITGNRLYDDGKSDEAKAKHDQALTLYERALTLGSERPAYLMAYGVLLLRYRAFEKARTMFLKAEKAPSLSKEERRQLRINYAICQWKMGKLDAAIEQLKIAEANGKNAMIYGSLGYMLVERAAGTRDFDEALEYNLKAYDYDEDDAVVLDNLGQLYLLMGERDKAKDYFLRAHKNKPSQVDTLYYLARLAAEDGEADDARAYLDTALAGNFSALSTITREQAEALRSSL